MSRTWDIAITAGIVGCGLLGGVFFAFSAFVMSGLNRLPARQATAAMQSFNVTAERPPLMLALFGTAVICGFLVYRAISIWGDRSAPLLLAGAVVYLAGAVLVTTVINVPLNNQLAALSAAGPGVPAHWQHFVSTWTLANHVRAVLSLAGCALLTFALLQRGPAGDHLPAGHATAASSQGAAVHSRELSVNLIASRCQIR